MKKFFGLVVVLSAMILVGSAGCCCFRPLPTVVITPHVIPPSDGVRESHTLDYPQLRRELTDREKSGVPAPRPNLEYDYSNFQTYTPPPVSTPSPAVTVYEYPAVGYYYYNYRWSYRSPPRYRSAPSYHPAPPYHHPH